MAKQVWEESKKVCEVCGTGIPNPGPINFSHLLPRGSYRRYSRDKRNIVIKCARHHEEWHSEGPKNLMFLKGWNLICDRYFELKLEANNVTQ